MRLNFRGQIKWGGGCLLLADFVIEDSARTDERTLSQVTVCALQSDPYVLH
jgi:hypothetical protein